MPSNTPPTDDWAALVQSASLNVPLDQRPETYGPAWDAALLAQADRQQRLLAQSYLLRWVDVSEHILTLEDPEWPIERLVFDPMVRLSVEHNIGEAPPLDMLTAQGQNWSVMDDYIDALKHYGASLTHKAWQHVIDQFEAIETRWHHGITRQDLVEVRRQVIGEPVVAALEAQRLDASMGAPSGERPIRPRM